MKTILHIEPSAFFVEVIRKKFNDSEYEYLSTDSYNEALILLEEFDVFEEYAHRFCEDTGSGVEIERKLVNRFKRSEPGSMLSKLNWLLPYGSAYRKKGFRYVSQRY